MVTAFEYEAVDHSSKTLLGQISAETRHDAVRILTSRGLTPVTMSPVRPATRGKNGDRPGEVLRHRASHE